MLYIAFNNATAVGFSFKEAHGITMRHSSANDEFNGFLSRSHEGPDWNKFTFFNKYMTSLQAPNAFERNEHS